MTRNKIELVANHLLTIMSSFREGGRAAKRSETARLSTLWKRLTSNGATMEAGSMLIRPNGSAVSHRAYPCAAASSTQVNHTSALGESPLKICRTCASQFPQTTADDARSVCTSLGNSAMYFAGSSGLTTSISLAAPNSGATWFAPTVPAPTTGVDIGGGPGGGLITVPPGDTG